jgi:hypothetical protein
MTRTNSSPSRLAGFATVLLLVGMLAFAGCGTKTVSSTGANGQVTTQTVPNVHFAKTKFLLHAGLAFGAIHRYIYKPLRNGALRSGAPGRIRVLLKGATAALFAVHELRVAHDDALSSNLLRPLANKISPSALLGSSNAADALGSASSGLGAGIKDISHNLGG